VLAGDGLHDTDRQSASLQHRALLDVDLEVAEQVVAVSVVVLDRARIPAEGAHCVGKRSSACVGMSKHRFIESAGERAAAAVGGAEAEAFLVRERKTLESDGHPGFG